MIISFSAIYFLIGIVFAQKINFGGELYIGEIFGAIYFALNFFKMRVDKNIVKIVWFSVVWSCVQLFSDIYNQNHIESMIKGVMAPLLFAMVFLSNYYYFKENANEFVSYLFGVLIGGLMYLILYPNNYFYENPWKLGIGGGMFSLFFLGNSMLFDNVGKKSFYIQLMILVVASLYFDSRSMAGFAILTVMLYWFINKYYLYVSTLPAALIYFGVIFCAIIFNHVIGELFAWDYFLSFFSDASAAKYRTQASGSFGILLGGRSEILISLQAFLDAPFFGHGSWAVDSMGYIEKYAAMRYELGYSLNDNGSVEIMETEYLIPFHSYIMGALVWCGVIGGCFWIYLLNSVLMKFMRYAIYYPMFYYDGVISFVWNVLFSPFGASARWATAIFVAGFFVFLKNISNKENIVSVYNVIGKTNAQ